MAASDQPAMDTETSGQSQAQPFHPASPNITNLNLSSTSPLISVDNLLPSTKAPYIGPAAAQPMAMAAQNFSVVLLATGLPDLVTRAVFLGLFTVLGFISNCILLATLAQSNRRRVSALNLLLISMASVNMVDCLVNMPLVLGASITQQWDYGEMVCRINAFSVQFVSMATVVGLCALSIDRCVGVHATAKYKGIMTLTKVNLLIVYTWVQAAALSFPLVANLITTSTLKARYLCSVTGGNSVIYICLSSTIGYILPILLIISIFISITCKNFREKKRKRKRKMDRNYSKALISDRSLRKEINTSKFVAVLTMLWCILEGPYLLLSYLQQYRDAGYGSVSYPWQVDLSLTWIRFSYPLMLPLLTFCWRREVWNKFKNLCLCRKSNINDDESVNGNSPAHKDTFSRAMNGHDSVARKQKEIPSLAFDVPVLFATEQGIHVQTLSKRPKAPRSPLTPEHFEDNPFAGVEDLGESRGSGIVTARKCDVNGSQDLLQIDDETSDYDSVAEGESLSASHPTDAGTYKPKSSTSTRHDSDILLIAETQKSFDNDAFEPDPEYPVVAPKKVYDITKEPEVEHVKQNSKDSTDGLSFGKLNGLLPEDERSMRHVRSSSDSGRGSEEGGTMPRREKTDKIIRSAKLATSQHDYAKIDDVTTNATSTDVLNQRQFEVSVETEEQPKVKKKKRKRKKAIREDETMELPHSRTLPTLSDPNKKNETVQEDDIVLNRPPIRLKPLDKPPSPVPVHIPPSPVKLPKKLPSPYKSSRVGSASIHQSPSKTRLDLLQTEDNISIKHQRSDSEASAIVEVEPAPQETTPAAPRSAARRRRTHTLTKGTDVGSYPNGDVTENGLGPPRERHGSSSSERSQRLAQSDSAADLRRLLPNAEDGTSRRSPRPSPRPRRPRRKSDIPPRADGKPPIGAH